MNVTFCKPCRKNISTEVHKQANEHCAGEASGNESTDTE